MAKITRVLQKIFGDSASSTEFGVIGSKADGSQSTTKDLASMQSNPKFLEGLVGITSDQGTSRLPYTEDINSLFYLTTSMLKYLYQSGVPEFITTENYYKDISLVLHDGILWRSTTGTDATPNIGNTPVGGSAFWVPVTKYAAINNVTDLSTLTGTSDGDVIEIRGFDNSNPLSDMPHYIANASSVKTPDGVAVIARPEGGNFEWPESVRQINIMWFGVDPTATTDNAAEFQKAISYVSSLTAGSIDFQGRPTLNLNGGSYKINSGTLTIDTSKMRINGQGASLNFVDNSTASEFIFLTNTGDIFDTYSNPIVAMENFVIEGRDRAVLGNNTGIKIESTVGGTVATAGLTLRNIGITNCEYGVLHLESSYNITYDTCNIFRNAVGIQFTSSPDMFERCSFLSCTIFNNTLGIGCDASNGVVYLIGCSMDYNSQHVVITAGGIELRGCHVEGTLNASAHFVVSGNATFHAEGGWWQFPRAASPTALEEFDASGSFNGNIDIQNVKFSSFGDDIPFTLNPEKVYVINPKPDATSLLSLVRFNRHFATAERYFSSGDFINDMWLSTSSTGTSTDRYTNPGLEISFVNDAGNALGGSDYYLEADKIFGAGSQSFVYLAIPLGNKRRASGKVSIKSMSGSTADVNVIMFYGTLSPSQGVANNNKYVPYDIISSRDIGNLTITLSSSYQSANFNMRERALDSDTHVFMRLDLFFVATGQVAIGEWYLSLV